MREEKVNDARVSPYFRISPRKFSSISSNSARFVADRIGWKRWTTGSLNWCFVIRENSIGSTGGDRSKRKSCFVRSLRRVERKTTRINQSSPIDLLCIFSLCAYTRSFYRTRTCGIGVYPRTIESNPGFLQNCNFLRFHAFRGKQYPSEWEKSMKMRRVILFRECLLRTFFFFFFSFFIFDEVRNVRKEVGSGFLRVKKSRSSFC